MANYYGAARSNYFRVKDIPAFIAECPVEVLVDNKKGKDYCFILFEEDGIATETYSDPEEDYVRIDWAALFAKHLEENSVAVFVEGGAEKLRYICGIALAFNHKGDRLTVDLNDIYGKVAEEWSSDMEVTEASY